MNDEPLAKPRNQTLDQRLASDPKLRERMHEIADMRDELIAQGCSLDEVEARVVEQVRLLSRDLLSGIAQHKSNLASEQAVQRMPQGTRDVKKK